MPQLARYKLRVVVLYVQMLSVVFNKVIYVVKITFCSVNALSVSCFTDKA